MSERRIGRSEVAELLGVDEGFLVELSRQEVVVPDRDGRYDVIAIEQVRVAWTMHESLGVNMAGLEVALGLLERWQDERRRVRRLLDELCARERERERE